MSKQIVVKGLLTSYSQSGKGMDVLLLHGWGDRKETYSVLTKLLGQKYRFTAVDLPGFGKSQPPKVAWDLSNYAQFLADFLDKINLKPDAVIGHSNGGALAIVALASGKLKSKKLILLAASGVRDTGGFKRVVVKLVAKIGRVFTFWLPKNVKYRLQKRLYGTIGSDMMAVPHLKETFKRTVRQDVQRDAAKLSLPVLLVYGSDDRATPIDTVGSRLQSRLRNSNLEIVTDAGHFIHHDKPGKVTDLIKEFLK